MKNKINKNLIPLTIVALVVIILLIIVVYVNLTKNNSTNHPQACDYNSPTKNYLKKEQFCVINFLCIRDTKAFSDSCGCGCEKISTTEINNTTNEKTFCTTESRNAQFCTANYKPVCGWFTSSVKCIKYPCAKSFSNKCFACMDNSVNFTTNGECPK